MQEAQRHGASLPLRLPVLRLPPGWRHLTEDELLQRAAQAYLAHRARGTGAVGAQVLIPPQRPGGLPERRQADRRGPSARPEPEPRLKRPSEGPSAHSVAAHVEVQGAAVSQMAQAGQAAPAAATKPAEDGREVAERAASRQQASPGAPSVSGWFLAGAIFLAVVQVVLALAALVPKAFDPRPGQQQTGSGAGAPQAPSVADQILQAEPALPQVFPSPAPPAMIQQVLRSAPAASQ